jgi:hypothetical protein
VGYVNEWRARDSYHGRLDIPNNGYKPGVKPSVTVGTIVVFQRLPRYVVEIRELPEDLWPQPYEEAWQQRLSERAAYEERRVAHPERNMRPWSDETRTTWWQRPIAVTLQIVDSKAEPGHWAFSVSRDWQILPEHYSVCRLCGELPWCRHVETEATVSREVEKAERLMAIPRGCCLGCGEPITSRMKATRFPGPNLWRPDWGTDSAVFHARSRDECSNGLWRYEEQWKQQGLDVLNPQLPEAAG